MPGLKYSLVSSSTKNVDHGYAWVIMFTAAFIEFLIRSVSKSFGLIFNDLKEILNVGNTAMSLLSGVTGISSFIVPIVSWLLTKYTSRKLVITGGLMMSFGLILTFFVDHIALMFLTFGILCGIGQALIFVPSVCILNSYFLHRLVSANGIRLSGASAGGIFFSLFVPFIIRQFYVKGAILIIGGIILNIVPLGILLRTKNQFKPKPMVTTVSERINPSFEYINEINSFSSGNRNCETNADYFHPNEILIMESIQFGFISNTHEITTINTLDNHIDKKYAPLQNVDDLAVDTKLVAVKQFKTQLIKSPFFWVIMIAMSFVIFENEHLQTIIPVHAENIGLPKYKSAFLITAMNVCECFSLLVNGWILDKLKIQSHSCFIVCSFLASITTITFAFIQDYTFMLCICGLLGLIEGVQGTVAIPLLVDFFGKNKIAAILGIFDPFKGVIVVFAPVITGYMADTFLRFNESIMFLAAVRFSSFALCALGVLFKNKYS